MKAWLRETILNMGQFGTYLALALFVITPFFFLFASLRHAALLMALGIFACAFFFLANAVVTHVVWEWAKK